MNNNECLICGKVTAFSVANYSGYTCECGQRYEWEEHLAIVLSDEQLAVLRKHAEDRRDG